MDTRIADAASPQPVPLSRTLSAAIVAEAMRVTGLLEAGFPVERTALLISPAGNWRLPLPMFDDPNVGTPMKWAMARILATEFVITVPDFEDGLSGPIAVIGMSKDAEAAISIPAVSTDHAKNSQRFFVQAEAAAMMRTWLPKRAEAISADDYAIIQEAFGPGGPWELTPEGEPQLEINVRTQ